MIRAISLPICWMGNRQGGFTKKACETTLANFLRSFVMYNALIVLKDGIFLFCKRIWFDCNLQLVCRKKRISWIGNRFREFAFTFMDSLHQIKFSIALSGLHAGQWMQSCCFFYIKFSENVLIESVHALALILSSTKISRVQPYRILSTTWMKYIRLVKRVTRSSPSSINKYLVVLNRQIFCTAVVWNA